MDLLEQPLEAVAFRLYSLPEAAAAGAAAWTCLAAVLAAATAAGVWRLRSSTPADFTGAPKPLELDTSTSLMSPPETERSSEKPPEPTTTTSSPAPSPKERYTAYYHGSGRVGCCVVEREEDEEEEELDPEDDDGAHGPSWENKDPFEWEVVRSLVPLVAPAAAADETGRHRIPRAASGSVVRLWDQGAGRSSASAATARMPRRRGMAGSVSIFF